jgi:hypothetical protein
MGSRVQIVGLAGHRHFDEREIEDRRAVGRRRCQVASIGGAAPDQLAVIIL